MLNREAKLHVKISTFTLWREASLRAFNITTLRHYEWNLSKKLNSHFPRKNYISLFTFEMIFNFSKQRHFIVPNRAASLFYIIRVETSISSRSAVWMIPNLFSLFRHEWDCETHTICAAHSPDSVKIIRFVIRHCYVDHIRHTLNSVFKNRLFLLVIRGQNVFFGVSFRYI